MEQFSEELRLQLSEEIRAHLPPLRVRRIYDGLSDAQRLAFFDGCRLVSACVEHREYMMSSFCSFVQDIAVNREYGRACVSNLMKILWTARMVNLEAALAVADAHTLLSIPNEDKNE